MFQVRLGELITRAGLASSEAVEQALAKQRHTSADLVEILSVDQDLEENALLQALSEISRFPLLPGGSIRVDAGLADLLPPETTEPYGLAPLYKDERQSTLHVATRDPTQTGPIDALGFRAGLRTVTYLASRARIAAINSHHYRNAPLPMHRTAPPSAPPSAPPPLPEQTPAAELLALNQQAARELEALFHLCVDKGLFERDHYLRQLHADPPAQ